jgi:FHS family L-fucose permease-like MFS transporter
MAIADRWNTRVSYFLVVPCFVYIAGWAVYIWHIDGRKMINLGKADDSSSVSSASTAVETGLDGLETPVNEKETIKIEV